MIPLRYEGEGQFQTSQHWKKRCDKDYVIGEVLTWAVHNERSQKSHAHYFAAVHEAWVNLPEALTADFPNSETLRKYALIKAGYCAVNKIVCQSNKEAITACAVFQTMDQYAICEVSGSVVTIYRAESQSYRTMGKVRFQESKEAVLNTISQIVGFTVTEKQEIAA